MPALRLSKAQQDVALLAHTAAGKCRDRRLLRLLVREVLTPPPDLQGLGTVNDGDLMSLTWWSIRSARPKTAVQKGTSTKGKTLPLGGRLMGVLAEGLVRPSPGGAGLEPACRRTAAESNPASPARTTPLKPELYPRTLGTLDSSIGSLLVIPDQADGRPGSGRRPGRGGVRTYAGASVPQLACSDRDKELAAASSAVLGATSDARLRVHGRSTKSRLNALGTCEHATRWRGPPASRGEVHRCSRPVSASSAGAIAVRSPRGSGALLASAYSAMNALSLGSGASWSLSCSQPDRHATTRAGGAGGG